MVATLSTASGACMPNLPMWLNVSHKTEWVSLHPGLRWPGVPGLRVEVNGQVRHSSVKSLETFTVIRCDEGHSSEDNKPCCLQVLSQGGDVSADQLADTTAETRTRWLADLFCAIPCPLQLIVLYTEKLELVFRAMSDVPRGRGTSCVAYACV